MDWPGITALVVAVLGTLWGLYEKLKKQRAADDGTTIGQWRAYAKERERQHKDDIARLEREIQASRDRIDRLTEQERKCALQAARQEEEIRQLRDELAELKAELAEKGIRDGSEQHRTLG